MGRSTKSEVELGYVSGVFGVRGEVRLFLYNPASHLLKGSHEVILRVKGAPDRTVKVQARKGAGKRVLGRFDGVADRDAAAQLKGAVLVMDRDALPALDGDEYYLWQVEGASVEVDGERIGRVVRVHTQGPIEVFEIDVGDGEPWFVPSLEDFVAGIDREASVVRLHPDALEE